MRGHHNEFQLRAQTVFRTTSKPQLIFCANCQNWQVRRESRKVSKGISSFLRTLALLPVLGAMRASYVDFVTPLCLAVNVRFVRYQVVNVR